MDEIRPINGMIKQPNPFLEEFKGILMVIFATLLYSITTYMFVLPNDFAPSGLSGILAFVSYYKGINTGTFTLLFLNVPLLILGFFYLSKRFALRTTISVFVLCGSLFLLALIDKEGKLKFVGTTQNGESDFGKKLLEEKGYARYEISNFAKKGYESKKNHSRTHSFNTWKEMSFMRSFN